MALLEVIDVTKSFGDTPVLRGVSFGVSAAKSSACSVRPAAARRRYCVSWPGWSRSTPARCVSMAAIWLRRRCINAALG